MSSEKQNIAEEANTKPLLLTIPEKWQKKWAESGVFRVTEDPKKKKFYCLEMYPYPSASTLHMGHVRNYTIGDVYARYKRMNGFNVLYPMGYDSFGLPAETAAKKEGIHPETYTESAISKIMEYQKALGNSYDWDRVLSSHDPDYYKWNQFFFLKLLEKGLAYRGKAPVNWCEKCQSVLANEEAEDGKCWRCGNDVVSKELEQWFFKITAYADRLLDDLDKIDWPDKIKTMQKNWIGKSEGVNIFFKLSGTNRILPAFTTRCDTIYSVTFVAIAPENPLLLELVKGTDYEKRTLEFIAKVKREKIEDRINEEKEKEGVFTGKYAINPVNGEEIPIFASNFALMYGTGIVMCDAHDKRDFRFARKYNIPLKFVISKDGNFIDPKDYDDGLTDDGILFNSGHFNGMNNMEALPKMAKWLEVNKMGQITINYKIKDWLISRQRYWGTPIPIIHCTKCGAVPVPIAELPVLLPKQVDFKSNNAMATNSEFMNVKCPKCKSPAKRETDTMGGFVDSSWYFLRYCDNKNKNEPFNPQKVKYWMPVDQYIGGAEHAVMHLMYARFFVKALKDLGYVDFDEPFAKLFNQGIVYKDGAKMSKSKGNVVTQGEIAEKYGIDTARLFLMFIAAPDKVIEWSDEGIDGSFRFLNRVLSLINKKRTTKIDSLTMSRMHKTIKSVTEKIEAFEYNKAIISIMAFANHLQDVEEVPEEALITLAKIISPFTPHLSEEIWFNLGKKDFISVQDWPTFDESKIDEEAEHTSAMIEKLVDDIKSVLMLIKKEKPNKIILFVAEQWKYDFTNSLKNKLESTRNVGELIKATLIKGHEKEISGLVPRLLKDMSKIPQNILTADKEFEAINASLTKLKSTFNCEIIVEKASHSKNPKAQSSMPSKPSLIIE